MVVTFCFQLVYNTRFFKQVNFNVTTRKLSTGTKVNTDKLTETRRVVVTNGFSITPSFKYRVGLDNLIFKICLVRIFARVGNGVCSNVGEILDDFLGVLSLSSSRFSSDQNRLVFTVSQHVVVSVISNGKQVRRHFRTFFSTVHIDNHRTVNRQPFVGIDTNTEKTGVSINTHRLITGSKIVQDTSFVQESHVGHVRSLFEFRRVDLLKEFFLYLNGLSTVTIYSDFSFCIYFSRNLTS